MTEGTIARLAADIVEGERNVDHGKAELSFDNIAALWSGYLGMKVTGTDVALMMALLKISRVKSGDPKKVDHYVDMSGYASLAGFLATRDA